MATVLLEAPAKRVYEVALANVRQQQDVKITRAAVTVSSDPAGATWRVVDGVMKVCARMNVECRIGP